MAATVSRMVRPEILIGLVLRKILSSRRPSLESDHVSHSWGTTLETLGTPLGFYVSHVGPLNQFVHLWAYESLADYERRCEMRDTHPDFPAYLSASEHLIVAQETRLIRSVDLPSLRKSLTP